MGIFDGYRRVCCPRGTIVNRALLAAGAVGLGVLLYKGRDIVSRESLSGEGWDNLHPEVKRRANLVLQDAAEEFKGTGLTVGVFEGWRSVDRQREVMGDGNSWVSNALNSYHPWGLAVDFVFRNKSGWTWEPTDVEAANMALWKRLGAIIKKHGFEWGGDWDSFDGPHAQYTGAGKPHQLQTMFSDPRGFITWA